LSVVSINMIENSACNMILVSLEYIKYEFKSKALSINL